MASLTVKPWQLVMNVIITITLVVVFVIFEVDGIVPTYHRGFYCHDNSINKPYLESQTISTTLLIVISVLLVIVWVLLCEMFKICSRRCEGSKVKESIFIGNHKMGAPIYRLLARLSLILVGTMMTMVIVGMGKKMLGRLRPHFMNVCKPDMSKVNCSDGYITDYVCTGTDVKALYEMRLSFPSGHSALAGYVAVTLVLYMQYTVKLSTFSLVKPLLQYCITCVGVACAFTRVSDYYHHWSDILVGLLIGALHALFTIYGLIRLHVEESSLTTNQDIESATSTCHLNKSDPHRDYNGNNGTTVRP